MRSTILRAVALAAFAGTSLTACGGDNGGEAEPGFTDKAVTDIEAAAIEDMKAATSLRLSGSMEQDGAQLTMDLAITTEGACDGTISMGKGTASIRGVGGKSYMKADEEFWTTMAGSSAPAVIAMIGDKWAVLPSGGDQFASFCDLDEFLKELDKDDITEEKVGETKEIDGAEVIEVTGEDEGGTTSVWVSTADPHYILEIEKVGGTEPGKFTFSDFNEDFAIEAPAADEIVDLSQM